MQKRRFNESDMRRIIRRIVSENRTMLNENFISDNAYIISKVIIKFLPIAFIPKMIAYIATGKFEKIFEKISKYKTEIENEVNSIISKTSNKPSQKITYDQIVSQFGTISNELVKLAKEKISFF